jgi:hypothetical protein
MKKALINKKNKHLKDIVEGTKIQKILLSK